MLKLFGILLITPNNEFNLYYKVNTKDSVLSLLLQYQFSY